MILLRELNQESLKHLNRQETISKNGINFAKLLQSGEYKGSKKLSVYFTGDLSDAYTNVSADILISSIIFLADLLTHRRLEERVASCFSEFSFKQQFC